jgi:hypothetical protein
MTGLLQDVRYALKQLRKNLGFTAVAVVTLALGIGANTTVFSATDAVLLKPLPYKDSNRLVMIWEQNPHRGWLENIVSVANYLDWRQQNHVFSDLAAFEAISFSLAGNGAPQEIPALRATSSLFSVLGVRPLRGRVFLPEEGKRGSSPVAVLSCGLWQQSYAQIALYRLQRQDEAVARALKRLGDARLELAKAESDRNKKAIQIQSAKAATSHSDAPDAQTHFDEVVLPQLKSELEMLQKEEEQARAEEAESERQLRDEQVKLEGLNDLLDRYNNSLEEVGQK